MQARKFLAPLALALAGCTTITPRERVALTVAGEILVTSIVLSSEHDHAPSHPAWRNPGRPIVPPMAGNNVFTPAAPCTTNPGACQ